MGSRSAEPGDLSTTDSTPEDVAVLYSWANLQGAKYRDYSASRREYRAQVRYRAARSLLERELKAQVDAETAAAEAERAARAATATLQSQDQADSETARLLSRRNAEEATRKAVAERVEAARRTEAAARTAILALREEREIAEAHSSARRQALVYDESELRRRQLAGPQPRGPLGDVYEALKVGQGDLKRDGPGDLQQFLFSGLQDLPGNSPSTSARSGWQEEDSPDGPPRATHQARLNGGPDKLQTSGYEDVDDVDKDERNAPAWLFPSLAPPRSQASSPAPIQSYKADNAGGGDTLQDSRERVAARWFALKGVFDGVAPELPAMHPIRPGAAQIPLVAVFSIAGGVGKTSVVATLGRALAAQGEKVVVADTTSHGLLPIYFRSRKDGRGGNVHPSHTEGVDSRISLVVHDFEATEGDDRQQELLTEEILRGGEGSQRLVLDLCTGSNWLIRRLVNSHPTVLVPMAPDMNSVIGLQAIERLFRRMLDSEGRPLLPYYVLNKFDASLPLHLDVREVFRRQLGDRLLRLAIRRSQSVSEALAEGMTVLDYAPDAGVSRDYLDLATWLRGVSPPATDVFRETRRGKR